MPTREQATIGANKKRTDRNQKLADSDLKSIYDNANLAKSGKTMKRLAAGKVEELKRIPRGKAGKEKWVSPKKMKAGK